MVLTSFHELYTPISLVWGFGEGRHQNVFAAAPIFNNAFVFNATASAEKT